MSKKNKKKEDTSNTLKDRLNGDILTKLQSKKQSLKQQEKVKQEQERQKRIEEKKKKEANKSFEELFNESEMDWTKFK